MVRDVYREMQIVSPDFLSGTAIPKKFTCEGENISPELSISAVPEGAQSLVLIVEDPDAPGGTYTHWLLWNISPTTERLERGGEGYIGPCPPSGTHRYIFTLYALDATLELEAGSNKDKLLEAMTGHIISQAELVGLYCKDENR